jgi:hypothetical protein
MMDFDRKDFIAQRIAQNGGMYQQMMMMQQQMLMMASELDAIRGTNMAQQMMGVAPAPAAPAGEVPKADIGGDTEEATNTKKARQRVAESTNPT